MLRFITITVLSAAAIVEFIIAAKVGVGFQRIISIAAVFFVGWLFLYLVNRQIS